MAISRPPDSAPVNRRGGRGRGRGSSGPRASLKDEEGTSARRWLLAPRPPQFLLAFSRAPIYLARQVTSFLSLLSMLGVEGRKEKNRRSLPSLSGFLISPWSGIHPNQTRWAALMHLRLLPILTVASGMASRNRCPGTPRRRRNNCSCATH